MHRMAGLTYVRYIDLEAPVTTWPTDEEDRHAAAFCVVCGRIACTDAASDLRRICRPLFVQVTQAAGVMCRGRGAS